jgi:hypothetical protein
VVKGAREMLALQPSANDVISHVRMRENLDRRATALQTR